MILDYVRDDDDTLRQCTLVCRSWLSSSSRYLFRTIHCPFFTSSPAPEVSMLAARLASTTRVHHYVRDLCLPYKADAEYFSYVFTALDILPSVRSLTIIALTLPEKPWEHGRVAVRSLEKLKLHFQFECDCNFDIISSFLLYFSHISTLMVYTLIEWWPRGQKKHRLPATTSSHIKPPPLLRLAHRQHRIVP